MWTVSFWSGGITISLARPCMKIVRGDCPDSSRAYGSSCQGEALCGLEEMIWLTMGPNAVQVVISRGARS